MGECWLMLTAGSFWLVSRGGDILPDGGLGLGQFVDVLCSFESLLTSVVGRFQRRRWDRVVLVGWYLQRRVWRWWQVLRWYLSSVGS